MLYVLILHAREMKPAQFYAALRRYDLFLCDNWNDQ